jgi:hypothetical protein
VRSVFLICVDDPESRRAATRALRDRVVLVRRR